jgi:hypothetical protein
MVALLSRTGAKVGGGNPEVGSFCSDAGSLLNENDLVQVPSPRVGRFAHVAYCPVATATPCCPRRLKLSGSISQSLRRTNSLCDQRSRGKIRHLRIHSSFMREKKGGISKYRPYVSMRTRGNKETRAENSSGGRQAERHRLSLSKRHRGRSKNFRLPKSHFRPRLILQ